MKMVKVTEIWQKAEDGVGEVFDMNNQRWLKCVALLAGGRPLYLGKDFVMEITQRTQEEVENFSLSKREGKER